MPVNSMEEWKDISRSLSPEMAQAAWKHALKMGGGDRKKAIPYYKLLLETAMQESKLGKMDAENPMQLTKGTIQDFKNRYGDELKEWAGEGTPLERQMGAAALIYRKRLGKRDISSLENRAKAWKETYNTSAGAGTPEKYVRNNKAWKWGD